MAHSLILGMTESGKTTCAKQLCAAYTTAGWATVVLDPMGDPAWHCSFRTSQPNAFLQVLWNSRRCMFFVDEGGKMIGRFDDLMVDTATMGRHWGHSGHYISQRGAQLNRTLRDQCSHLFLFTTALDDCKTHANEWNKPELRNASSLPALHYYHATRYGTLETGVLTIPQAT